jgi:hypothetical protein
MKFVFEEGTPKEVEDPLRSANPWARGSAGRLPRLLRFKLGKRPGLCPFKTFIVATVTG